MSPALLDVLRTRNNPRYFCCRRGGRKHGLYETNKQADRGRQANVTVLSAALTDPSFCVSLPHPPLTTTFEFRKQHCSCDTVSVRGASVRTRATANAVGAVGSECRRGRYGLTLGGRTGGNNAHCSTHACFPSSASPRALYYLRVKQYAAWLDGYHYLRQGTVSRPKQSSVPFPDPNPYEERQPTAYFMQVRRWVAPRFAKRQEGHSRRNRVVFSGDPRAFASHDGKNYTVCRDSSVGCGGRKGAGGAYRQWARARGCLFFRSVVLPQNGGFEYESVVKREPWK